MALSFEESLWAAVVVVVCFGGWGLAGGTLGVVVAVVVVREGLVAGAEVRVEAGVVAGVSLVEWPDPGVALEAGRGEVCLTGCTEKVTLLGELELAGVGEERGVWTGDKGGVCFGNWEGVRVEVGVGALAELETAGWIGVGLGDLLGNGTRGVFCAGAGEVTELEAGEGVGVGVWVGV